MGTGHGIRMALVLTLVVSLGAGLAIGGKPGKPPSGKSIYYVRTYYGTYKMASDGSGKTSLPGTVYGRMSDVRYGEGDAASYYTVTVQPCGVTPEGGSRNNLVVGPVEVSGPTIEILNDPNVSPGYPTFRPGATPRVTYVAVVWDADDPSIVSAGLYQIEFSIDGSTIGDPELLLECDTYWYDDNISYEPETYPQMYAHDWLDESTIVYGDDHWNDWPQLYMWDTASSSSPVALIADGEPRMVWGAQFNSDGTRVLYANYEGVYEVSTGGSATPTCWVAKTTKAFAQEIDYLDDDTIVYTWFDSRAMSWDIYKRVRGSGPTNLTGSVAEACRVSAAR